MKNGTKFLIGLCAVFSLSAKAQFFPIPADVVPYGDNQRSLKGSSVDFRFSDSTKQLLVGLTASASAPAYSFPGSGNSDNGMWRSGTDEISFSTAGQTRLTIGSTGSITFGTSVQGFVSRTGDTMSGPLVVAASGNSIIAGENLKATQDIFAGQAGSGTSGKLRLLCDSGSECWRLGPPGSGGATNIVLRNVTNSTDILDISASGVITQPTGTSPWVRKSGDTMTGALGLGTLQYAGATSGAVQFQAPAVAGSQVYTLTSAAPTSDSYLMGGTSGVLMWYVAPSAEIFVSSANGYGSTNTVVRRWTTTQVNNGGVAITFTQSAASGDSFTVNESGTYAVNFCDQFGLGAANMGISVNSNQLTTGIQSITTTHVACGVVTAGVNLGSCCSTTLKLNAADVVRAHTDGSASGSNFWMQSFRIRKLGP